MAPQAIDSSNARSCNYALLVAGQSPSLWRTETENGGWWWFTIRHYCHFNSSLTKMCWGPLNFRSKSYIYNDTADEKRMIKMRIKRATDNKSQCSVARGRKEVTNGQLTSLGIRMWWQSLMVDWVWWCWWWWGWWSSSWSTTRDEDVMVMLTMTWMQD